MSLPGYDAWRLASPPEHDTQDLCPECGKEWEGDAGQCASCGYGEPGLVEQDREDRARQLHMIGLSRAK